MRGLAAISLRVSSPPRRIDFLHGGAVRVAEHQHGEFGDVIELRRLQHRVVEAVGGHVDAGRRWGSIFGCVQAGVVKAAAQVGVAVFEEADGAVVELRIDLHIGLRQRFVGGEVSRFEAAVVFGEGELERVRVIGLRLAFSGADDLHKHVRLREFARQRDVELRGVFGKGLRDRFVRLDDAESARVLADEGIAAEAELRIHEVVVERDLGEVFPVE